MISIVIPVYNAHDMTQECIDAIRENTQDFELIIIDNGSDPAFKAPFTGDIELRVIRNEENKGFPIAVNQGIRAAEGDIICLLNNDVIVTENWFERLEWHLLKYDIVGPMTNFCAGMQRTTVPVYQDKKELNQRAIEFQVENAFQSQEVNWIIGFCMAFKKSIFDEIGPFDESMWPSSGEEINFCFRAQAAGHKIGIARDIYIHHFGSVTFQDLHNKGILNYPELCQKTSDHVSAKWGDFWQNQVTEKEAI